ncbi:hypothetical protein, partial [Legionella jordanis]|uniref:hypothetical protein n=1 Tax=Legionella jordanis TaxID=456 RepID=UPI001C80DE78
ACFNIDRIWLSLNFDFFMQNLLAHTLRENSTFGINYFVGGLPNEEKEIIGAVSALHTATHPVSQEDCSLGGLQK